jgi:hypothetical protein
MASNVNRTDLIDEILEWADIDGIDQSKILSMIEGYSLGQLIQLRDDLEQRDRN